MVNIKLVSTKHEPPKAGEGQQSPSESPRKEETPGPDRDSSKVGEGQQIPSESPRREKSPEPDQVVRSHAAEEQPSCDHASSSESSKDNQLAKPQETQSSNTSKQEHADVLEIDSAKDAENHYLVATTDPRYQRWLHKLKPKFTQGRYWKNYVANPSHLPVIGIGVNIYRAGKAHELKGRLATVSTTAESDDTDWDNTMVQMKKTANLHIVKTHTKVAVSLLLTAFPVTQCIPGLGTTGGAAAGTVVGEAAEKGAETGAKRGAKKATAAVTRNACDGAIEGSAVGEIFSVWEHTQAFLMYLGQPYTRDNLYAKWETSRMALKTLYGAHPKDDLFLMKPDAEMEARLKQIESQDGGVYDLEELGVSLLFLLWRGYSCWRGPYWEKYKDTLRGAKLDQVRREDRKKDYIRIQKNLRNDPGVIKIGRQFKNKIKDIFERVIPQRWPFPDAKDAKDREKKQKWIFKFIMAHVGGEEKWAYVDEPSGSFNLLAVALFQPGKHSLLTFKGGLAKSSVSGPLKFGVDGYKQVVSRFLAEEAAIKKAAASFPKKLAEKASVAYLFAGDPKGTRKLLAALANQPYPTIALCYDNETEQMDYCKEAGFRASCVEEHSEGSGAVHAFVHDVPKWFEESAMNP